MGVDVVIGVRLGDEEAWTRFDWDDIEKMPNAAKTLYKHVTDTRKDILERCPKATTKP